jgi:hypothetical protein
MARYQHVFALDFSYQSEAVVLFSTEMTEWNDARRSIPSDLLFFLCCISPLPSANRLALADRRPYGELVRRRRAVARSAPLAAFLTFLTHKSAVAQDAVNATPPVEAQLSVGVERDELAASCPDLAWFKARIASHAGKAGQSGSFKITLGRLGEAWHARIERREQGPGVPAAHRVLHDRSPTCGPLAEAVAVTVAILADESAQRDEPETVPTPVPPTPEAPLNVNSPPPIVLVTPRGDSRTKVWVGASGGGAMSFVSPVAPVFGISAALEYASLRAGMRLMMTPQQKFDLDPGRVFVQAWLVTVFGCLQLRRERLGTALCAAVDASVLRASAEGFDQPMPGRRSYEAAGLEGHPGWQVSDGVRVSAVLGALVPFTRESFSVTGRGVAYLPPSINWRMLLVFDIGVF